MNNSLKLTKNSLFMSTFKLLKDNEGLQANHKNMKSHLNAAKLEQTHLEAEFSKPKELDITYTKQCEICANYQAPGCRSGLSDPTPHLHHL
ncbi:hypothetical protein AMELA_G00271990 [Ameiurus melas]|uniref:Uncharacterized protein n=1 Tax=Ameiurus melas TaxID=219545 RepID=A0A7J5ZKV0_AMEME|nr:hypothetical protein AMELA_G00271990 [Ameiurus melas]